MKRRHWITMGLLGITCCGLAQDNKQLLITSAEHPVKGQLVTRLKWLVNDFDLSKEYHVFRRLSGAKKWDMLTETPVKYKDFQLTPFLANDSKIRHYLNLLQSIHGPMPDLIQFGLMVKVLEENEFAKYLGIAFDDSTAVPGSVYDYKVTELIAKKSGKKKNNDLLQLLSYDSKQAAIPDPPQSIVFEELEKEVEFYWQPEPDRYFGVNLYRAVKGEDTLKINKDIIIPVQSKNAEGFFDYPDVMYADSSLIPGITYHYHLAAIDFFGIESTPSQSFEVTLTDKIPPKPPKLEKLVPYPDGRVEIAWTANEEPDLNGFRLYRFNSLNDSVSHLLTPKPITNPSFQDLLTRSGVYRYQVVAEDLSGNISESPIEMVHLKDKIPPVRVSSFTATLDSVFVTMHWEASPSEDVWGYRVYRSAFGRNENHFSLITDGIIRGQSHTDTLPSHVKSEFTYRVVALDTSMNSSEGAYATLALPDYRAPGTPAIIGIRENMKKYTLTWRARRERDLAQYTVYYRAPEGDWENVGTYKNTEYPIPDEMEQGDFRLTATDESGNESPPSDVISFHRPETRDNIIYKQFDVIPEENGIRLRWSTNNETSMKGHAIYRKAVNGNYERVSELITENNFLDTPKTGNTYSYQLRGYTKSGKIIQSIEKTSHSNY
ncbi:hypothetical protein FNH22_06140 [Fulvivirga sp. M361]|uniref:fibronectin type III domain-containing protein n=1 Tax=Fulvivirga sp. M361 TaxID=2594266 RepID=UPI00117BD63B|nr:hypothetical protein [Fulvivirga sp. M361]TRX60623.1 hypothetical protein FNH22_06140 [Fulvivirga sp. M361]